METIDKIKMLLEEKGLDQKDLTSYLGITKSVFSAWKKGTSTSYTKYYKEIADFFGVPVSAIVDDETAMEIDQILFDFRKMKQHERKEKIPVTFEPVSEGVVAMRHVEPENEKKPLAAEVPSRSEAYKMIDALPEEDYKELRMFIKYLKFRRSQDKE